MPGAYKNFAELEEKLTIDELKILLESYNKIKRDEQIFEAGLVGMDLIKAENDARIKAVRERAQEKLYGEKALSDMTWAELGIEIEIE